MNLLEKKQFVDANMHFVPQADLAAHFENFAYVLAKNSSSIEGKEIKLAQVISLIKGMNVGGDSDLNRSVYNNYQAFKMVEERAKKHEPLTEEFFKDVHECLVNGIYNGGLYRNVDIKIKGSAHIPCSYLKVYDRMTKFFYDINNSTLDPLDLAAYIHLQIAKVHPFLDANGRIARLMMDYQLISSGYLPISIPVKRREEYFNTLEEFKVNKTEAPFRALLEDLLNAEYDRLIELINHFMK